MVSTQPEKSELPPDLAEEFLKLCLRARRQPSLLNKVQETIGSESFDWSEVLELADFEGVSPLIYDTLKGANIAPAAVLDDLYRRYVSTASRNLVLFHELDNVLQQPAREDGEVIVLKGAALAETVYDNYALRPMLDLDILVKPASLQKMQAVLESVGFIARPARVTDAELAYRSEVHMHKDVAGGVWLDLHWRLFSSPFFQKAMSANWFWETAQATQFGQSRALVLGPEAQVLHLCVHLSLHHYWDRKLLLLYDLSSVIHTYQSKIVWRQLLEQAHINEVSLPLKFALPLIAREWAAPVPGDVIDECQALRTSPDEKRAFAWHTTEGRPRAELVRADLEKQSGWSSWLYYAWTRLLPSPVFMRFRYRISHPILLPLFYLYRLGVGLSIGLKMIWHRPQVGRIPD